MLFRGGVVGVGFRQGIFSKFFVHRFWVIRRRFCRGKIVKTKNLGKSVLGQVKQFGGSKTCLGGSGMFTDSALKTPFRNAKEKTLKKI